MSYIVGMNLTNVRTNAEGPEFALGTVGRTSDGKQYKYVQYNSGAGAVAAVGRCPAAVAVAAQAEAGRGCLASAP